MYLSRPRLASDLSVLELLTANVVGLPFFS